MRLLAVLTEYREVRRYLRGIGEAPKAIPGTGIVAGAASVCRSGAKRRATELPTQAPAKGPPLLAIARTPKPRARRRSRVVRRPTPTRKHRAKANVCTNSEKPKQTTLYPRQIPATAASLPLLKPPPEPLLDDILHPKCAFFRLRSCRKRARTFNHVS
jgi:hypothetical protein